MINFNEKNLESIKKVLKDEGVITIKKGLFESNINKLDIEEPYYEIRTLYDGEFFEFKDGLLGVDETIKYLESLSTEGATFKKFTLKNKMKEDILDKKYKVFLKRNIDENQKFIRLYKKNHLYDSEFKFSDLAKKINADFTSENFYIKDMDNFILVSSGIINCDSLKELFPKEMTFIDDVLGSNTCPYCNATVINERITEYLEFQGCVGREKICPECVSVYYLNCFGMLDLVTDKSISNIEKVQIVDYILKYTDK